MRLTREQRIVRDAIEQCVISAKRFGHFKTRSKIASFAHGFFQVLSRDEPGVERLSAEFANGVIAAFDIENERRTA